MKPVICALVLGVALTLAQPAIAAPKSPQDQAAELARQGLEKLMQALELMIKHIPQYETPIINENGDIIIKRKNPPGHSPDKKGAEKERNI
ncbi:MAG: hypothetical protein O2912_03340 [Proteobacteria bacterium]|nr:hypothetical protein [Pseudomonadota bacterium]